MVEQLFESVSPNNGDIETDAKKMQQLQCIFTHVMTLMVLPKFAAEET